MRRFLLFLLTAFTALALSSPAAFAGPFFGAELSYTNLGGFDYQITFTYYRNCEGIFAPPGVTVSLDCSANPSFSFTTILYQVNGTGQEITGTCPDQSSYCSGGSLFGIQKFVYQGLVTLAPCGTWTIAYEWCCRQPSNTIQNPTSQSIRVEASLNNWTSQANSSPQFTNDPVMVFCGSQTTCFNPGAVDPDGDSLSFSLETPMTSATGFVTYIPPYSAAQPLVSNPPVSIDLATGEICISPVTAPFVSLMAIKVEEWRRVSGMLTFMGSVTRDIQFVVLPCNSSVPTLSGMDTTLSPVFHPDDTLYSREVCLGNTLDFTIKGHDADSFDPSNTGSPEIMHISWNNGIPGAAFTTFHNGTDSAYARFTWTPTGNDTGGQLHCFTATVSDSACPYSRTQTFAYCVRVREAAPLTIGGPDTICLDQTASLHADSGFTSYLWSTGDTTMSIQVDGNLLGPGEHSFSVTGSDGPCESFAAHSLFVDACTAVPSVERAGGLTLFPNPSPGVVSLKYEGCDGPCTLEVLDGQGRLLHIETIYADPGMGLIDLDLGQLGTGTYLVRMQSNAGVQHATLILLDH